MNKKINLALILGFLMLLVVPSTLGVSLGSFGDSLGFLGETLEDMLQSVGFRFFAVFILFFMLMYAVFAAGINKVSVFKGDGYAPNKHGKIIAASLGLITSMGIAYWANFDGALFTERILSFAGIFGGIAFAFLVFALTYFNTKQGEEKPDWTLILFATGLAMLAYASLVGENNWDAWGPQFYKLGLTAIIVAIIFFIIKIFTGGPSSGDEGNRPDTDPNTPPGQRRPSVVAGFNAAVNADGTVNLGWSPNDPSENVTNYQIQRRRKGGRSPINWSGWRTDTNVVANGGDSTAVDRTPINPVEQYYYRIRARNRAGPGPWFDDPNLIRMPSGKVELKVRYADNIIPNEIPIDSLSVSVSGVGNATPAADGTYNVDNVPLHPDRDLIIEDPLNVYQRHDGNNQVTFSNNAGNNSELKLTYRALQPIPTARTFVELNVSEHGGNRIPDGTEFIVYAMGGFGRENPMGRNGRVPVLNGKLTVGNVPAGYVIRLQILDPTGMYNPVVSDIDANNPVLLREIRDQANAYNVGAVELNRNPETEVNGVCKDNTTNNPLQLINVEFDNHAADPNSPYAVQSGDHGQYSKSLPQSIFRVSAKHHYDQFRTIPSPYLNNYHVGPNRQTLNIPLVPNQPAPINTRKQVKPDGTIDVNVRF